MSTTGGVLLRLAEVAERLRCSPRKVRQMIAAGVLPSVKTAGLRRVPELSLQRWMERQAALADSRLAELPDEPAPETTTAAGPDRPAAVR